MSQLWLVRHGETEWSRSGAHTGRTDIPLTQTGREQARAIARLLAGRNFALVLTSPLQRAQDTCALAGFAERARIEPNLREWDYGDYEGRTTAEIRAECPQWSLWRDGVPNGESIADVARRAQSVIAEAAAADGDVVLFSHGHLLRILAACWVGLPPDAGRLLALGTASLSSLGYERETRVVTRWNLSASE